MQLQSPQRTQDCSCVRRNLFLKILPRSVIVIGNSQPPTRVDITDVVALSAQCGDQNGHALERLLKGTYIGNLRPDVNAYSRHFQIRFLRGPCVERSRLRNGNAELVLM